MQTEPSGEYMYSHDRILATASRTLHSCVPFLSRPDSALPLAYTLFYLWWCHTKWQQHRHTLLQYAVCAKLTDAFAPNAIICFIVIKCIVVLSYMRIQCRKKRYRCCAIRVCVRVCACNLAAWNMLTAIVGRYMRHTTTAWIQLWPGLVQKPINEEKERAVEAST